ncbi:Putative serine protease HhoA [bacterium HR20]|nr:Putative serine protease HhoA [bacterium HR20]
MVYCMDPNRATTAWAIAALYCLFVNAWEGAAQPLNPKQIFEQCAGAVVLIQTESASGTGFFINSQYIVTNKHVIGRPGISETVYYRYEAAYFTHRQIQVTTRAGTTIPVIEVNAFREHPDIDLAVLKVARHQGVTLPISEKPVEVGEPVVAIGHPRGMEWTLTQGSISKRDFSEQAFKYSVQLDLATDFGSSGGPVINKFGQVVAIVQGAYPLSATGKFGIRSDILAGLLNYYGIPYNTEPIVLPSTEELQSLARLIQEQQRSLGQLREQLDQERSELDRQRSELARRQNELTERERKIARESAELDAKLNNAKLFLKDYEDKRSELQDEYERKYAELKSFKDQLDDREKAITSREQRLNERERWLQQKEAEITEKLGDHFSIDVLASPMYEIERKLLVPLRASVGFYYRFGFERDNRNVVIQANKVGIVATRQLSLLGWEQDEVTLAIEVNSQFRLSIGAVLRQRDVIRNMPVSPREPLYTASIMADLLPESSFHLGLGVSGLTDRQFRSPAVMVGFQLGFEINFLRW